MSINIDELLNPNAWKIREDGEVLKVTITDEELDPIECMLEGDGCIKIDTSKLNYLVLDANTLMDIADLVLEAEEIYAKRDNQQ